MLKLSRRDFIHAGCTVAAASLMPKPALAWPHGSASANPNRATINVPSGVGFINLAKSVPFAVPPAQVDSNGYPTSNLSSNVGGQAQFNPAYYDKYVIEWTGTAFLQFVGQPAIVYSGGASVPGITPSASGSVQTNFGVNGTSPAVVFKFGGLVASVSGGNGSLVTVTTSLSLNFGSGLTTGSQVSFAVGCSSNLINGPNSDGSWTITNVSGTQFTLNNSTGVVSPTVTGSGGPGTQTEAILQVSAPAVNILAGQTISGFTGLIICTLANRTAAEAGQIWEPTLVSQLQYLMNNATASKANYGWLRFMDVSGVQGSYECDFANRMPASYISYNSTNYFPLAYQTTSSNGAITNTSDALTCADATQSVLSGGAYIDSAIIQGTVNVANTTANPTLAVGTGPAAPIFDFTSNPNLLAISAPPASAGLNMVFTFSAPAWTLPSLNGGTTYTFTYTTVSGDTASVSALCANLLIALNADATLAAAKIGFGNTGSSIQVYPRTAQAGMLTITYSSGPGICTVTRMAPGTLAAGTATFIYNKILGGWIYRAGGMIVSVPFEAIVELCNRVGSHCWYNWPVYTKAAFITSVTQFFGDATTGLASGLRFGTEVGNELWNFSQGPFAKCLYLGFGIGIYPNASELQQWSWGALRTIQYGNLSKTAWSGKGRSLSDHYIFQMGAQKEAFTGSQNFTQNGLEGAALTTSNTIYSAWSALAGGLGAADYSTVGNRPIDGKDSNGAYVTATGHADYWYSDYIRETADNNNNTVIFGSVSDNATWLQASLDYTNGNTASAFSALATMFSTQRGSASIVSGSCTTTGKLTLTLSGSLNITTQPAVSDIVFLFQLTGTGLANISTQGGFTTISPTSGTTVTLNVPGLVIGSITITGGVLVDQTASTINPVQNANWVAFQFFWANFESVVGSFDSARISNGLSKAGIMHYEGAPQWSVSNSAINGTNSTTATSDLVTQMTNLSWNVNSYDALGGTGATAIAHVAQQVLNLIQGWKLDTDHNGNPANTGSYKNMIKTNYYQALVAASAGKGREVKPAQYGYQNDIWGLFPINYQFANQYSNYDAIHEFNAGS